MSLIKSIQEELIEGKPLGPILLKLRFLASRLGSDVLEGWVKHESDGYPTAVDVPEYRQIGVSYTASFSGPYGSGIQNAPIPSFLINKYAGENWLYFSCRQSISSIDSVIDSKSDSDALYIDSSNLILLLQGNVYPNYNCIGVRGTIGRGSFVEIANAVRTKVLDLVIEIEKSISEAVEIGVNNINSASKLDATAVSNITNQVVYGNMTSISNSGSAATFSLNFKQGDIGQVVNHMVKGGIPEQDAKEFAELIATEHPESADTPFGAKAKQWIAKNIGKALDGTWKVGISVATQLLSAAAMQFYGLK